MLSSVAKGTFVLCAVLFAALAFPVQAKAQDSSNFTVTVNASVSPTNIAYGDPASGSATASISANNPAAEAELQGCTTTTTFSIGGVFGADGAIPPSASINSDGSNLLITCTSDTDPYDWQIEVDATVSWTDPQGNSHSVFGWTSVSVTSLATCSV